MRRFLVIAVAGAGLAGCSSFSMDAFKSAPPTVQVQLDSVPPGADAKTSSGPGCTTPCSVAVAAADRGFSVTFTKDKFQPVTIPVQVVNIPGDFSSRCGRKSRRPLPQISLPRVLRSRRQRHRPAADCPHRGRRGLPIVAELQRA
jgi:hypothetical protein